MTTAPLRSHDPLTVHVDSDPTVLFDAEYRQGEPCN